MKATIAGQIFASLPLVAVIGGFACRPGPVPDPDECYAIDENGDWPLEPTALTENFCGRGPTPSENEDEGRGVTAVCVPAPSTGCDPCMLSAEEVDQRLQDEIAATFADAGCPANYQPERFIRGCFAAWPDQGACCYTAEYFTDKAICDPVPDDLP